MMSADVQDLLKAVCSLPPDKQVELLQGLAQALAQALSPLAAASAEFWSHRPIDALARQQRAPVFADIGALAMPGWPHQEAADDLITYIYDQRHADRDG